MSEPPGTSEPRASSAELVERGDLDELTRHVGRLCDEEAWDALEDLRHRCRRALERGKQLWPVAAHIEYRLALQAPGPWAARMLEAGAGRFAFGPLPEVAASTHAWDELSPHLASGPAAALSAHERVLRGEDLTADRRAAELPPVLELPLVLSPWEPRYALAAYRPDKADFPAPWAGPVGGEAVVLPAHVEAVDDGDTCRALTDLATAWTTESDGRAEAQAVVGGVGEALAALGLRQARVAVVDPGAALAMMAWTAASGGAHGRRRGAATGRFAAWWALAALAGLTDDWPVDAGELGDAAADLAWYMWDAGEPETGWTLRLAVEDPVAGLAWALAATDAA